MSLLDPKATLLTLKVPEKFNSQQRRELADLVIEHIFDRTDRGLGVDGKPFKAKYSESYANSLAGKIGGKKKGGTPNLQLSGDMLASMELLKDTKGQITIGFKDQTERAKAEGNILGSYGSDSPNPKLARPFLGVSTKKLRELIDFVDNGG